MITSRKRFEKEADFLKQIEKIAAAKPFGIVLREKDLPVKEYSALARKVRDICRSAGTSLIVHSHPEAARELGIAVRSKKELRPMARRFISETKEILESI